MSEITAESRLRNWCNSLAKAWLWLVGGFYLGFGYCLYYLDIEIPYDDPIYIAFIVGMPLIVMLLPKAVVDTAFGIVDYTRKRRAFRRQQTLS